MLLPGRITVSGLWEENGKQCVISYFRFIDEDTMSYIDPDRSIPNFPNKKKHANVVTAKMLTE